MRRKRKQRRQPHGSAWHWKQTDSWYFTQPGAKKRVALFDEDGQRIRGKENASLEESVGEFWFGEGTEVVVEGDFVGFLGAKTV